MELFDFIKCAAPFSYFLITSIDWLHNRASTVVQLFYISIIRAPLWLNRLSKVSLHEGVYR